MKGINHKEQRNLSSLIWFKSISKVTNILKAVRGQLISKGHLASPILSKTNEKNST